MVTIGNKGEVFSCLQFSVEFLAKLIYIEYDDCEIVSNTKAYPASAE